MGQAFTESQPHLNAKLSGDRMTVVGKIKQRGKELGIAAKNRILDLAYPPFKGLRDTMKTFKASATDIYMAVLGVAQVLMIMQIGSSVRQANVCVCAFV